MALYDGIHEVLKEEVLEKVKYFYDQAGRAMEYWDKGDTKIAIDLARVLRNSLQDEYKNNSLMRIEKIYGGDINFINYRAAVREACASVSGQLTQKNVYSFLYNVQSSMSHYFPDISG